jgi:hypothetical protein
VPDHTSPAARPHWAASKNAGGVTADASTVPPLRRRCEVALDVLAIDHAPCGAPSVSLSPARLPPVTAPRDDRP